VGFLDLVARIGASCHSPDDRSDHPAHLAAHEWLRQPHFLWENKNFTDARGMRSEDKDYHLRDLYDSIATLYRA
jgi:hypothetical protein